MPETEKARAKRLAERKRVDDHIAAVNRKARAARAANKKPLTAAQKRATAASSRRKQITKKVAPTGFQRLIAALTKKKPEKKK